MEPITFKKVQPVHSEILAALHSTSFDRPWGAVEFVKILDHPGTCAILALNQQTEPLGFILVRSVIDEAEILTLCVNPVYRLQKVATRLLDLSTKQHKNKGIGRMFLEVDEKNLPATGLYVRCGFVSVGERPEYYHQPDKTSGNAIVMARDI